MANSGNDLDLDRRDRFPKKPTRSSSIATSMTDSFFHIVKSVGKENELNGKCADSRGERVMADHELLANNISFATDDFPPVRDDESDSSSVSLCDLNDAESKLRSKKGNNANGSMPMLESFCNDSSHASPFFCASAEQSRASLDCSLDMEELTLFDEVRGFEVNELGPIAQSTSSGPQESRWDHSRNSSQDSQPSLPSFGRW
jgi:hypothetical protein